MTRMTFDRCPQRISCEQVYSKTVAGTEPTSQSHLQLMAAYVVLKSIYISYEGGLTIRHPCIHAVSGVMSQM